MVEVVTLLGNKCAVAYCVGMIRLPTGELKDQLRVKKQMNLMYLLILEKPQAFLSEQTFLVVI